MDEETTTKTAVDYLLVRGRTYEVSLLLRAGTRLEKSPDPYSPLDYSLCLSVPAGVLEFYREALNQERTRAIAEAYEEAIMGSRNGVGRVHVWTALAPSKPYPGSQQALKSSLEGDTNPLNQGTVATTSPEVTPII